MPLTTCPDCGREVSTLAKSCPQCGRPLDDTALPLPEVSVSEHTLYQDSSITVTNRLVTVGETSYALNKINSVSVASKPNPARTAAESSKTSMQGCGGCLVLFGGMALLGMLSEGSPEVGIVVFALLITIGGVVALIQASQSKATDLPEFEYDLTFATSSGNQQVLSGFDRAQLEEVARVIRDAIGVLK